MIEQRTTPLVTRAVGSHLDRADGPEKVTGRATYAVEHGEPEGVVDPLHVWLVQSTVAKGRVVGIESSVALSHPGVVSVLDHLSAPRLVDTENRELAILQDD